MWLLPTSESCKLLIMSRFRFYCFPLLSKPVGIYWIIFIFYFLITSVNYLWMFALVWEAALHVRFVFVWKFSSATVLLFEVHIICILMGIHALRLPSDSMSCFLSAAFQRPLTYSMFNFASVLVFKRDTLKTFLRLISFFRFLYSDLYFSFWSQVLQFQLPKTPDVNRKQHISPAVRRLEHLVLASC